MIRVAVPLRGGQKGDISMSQILLDPTLNLIEAERKAYAAMVAATQKRTCKAISEAAEAIKEAEKAAELSVRSKRPH
jgi:hypothetical protein